MVKPITFLPSFLSLAYQRDWRHNPSIDSPIGLHIYNTEYLPDSASNSGGLSDHKIILHKERAFFDDLGRRRRLCSRKTL
jgi:hypothetical protein